MSSIEVKIFRQLSELETIADEWDELAANIPNQIPLISHAWISTFFKYRLTQNQEWCCLLAISESKLIGVLPLIITPRKVLGFKRTILSSPQDRHTRSVSILISLGREEDVITSFFSSLQKVAPNWYSVYFEQMTFSSIITDQLSQRYVVDFANIGLYLPTNGDFTEFRSGLKKSFRTNLTTATNRINKYPNVAYEFLIEDQATVSSFERFINIEVLGWKGRMKSAIVQSPDLIEFYTELVKKLSNRGWLEWHFLMADGKTIAGNLAIRCGRSLVIWKLGYDEEYAKCSPGTLLFEEEVKYAFESEIIDRIDLITSPKWAKYWKMENREYSNLWIYPSSLLPLIADIIPKRIYRNLREVSFLRKIVQLLKNLLKKA